MADFGEITYSAKQTAVKKAAEEVRQALNTVSDIFKNFQDDYLALLLDNENLRSLLRKSHPPDSRQISKILRESPKKVPSPPSPCHEMDPDTPGIVETTQFPVKPRPTPSKPQNLQSKKSLFPAAGDLSVLPSTSHTPKRPHSQTGVLSLSRRNVQTRINSSGKVEKQSKLVLQPLSQKTDINNIRNPSLNTTNLEPRELEIEETMFEKKVTEEENREVVDASPNLETSRKKGRLRLKSKGESLPKVKPQSPLEEIVLSDFEMDDMEPSLTQIEKEASTQSKRNARKMEKGGKFLGVEKENQERPDSSDLVKAVILDSGDESRVDPDETYFPRGETSSRGRRREIVTKKTFPENNGLADKMIDTTTDKIFDMDVDGDWDTDVSMDKWTSSPKKMMDSFDIVPQKKNPNFAFKGSVVRGKSERAKLKGWSCKDCQVYYENMNLTEEELKKRMDQCSRHRSKYNERYNTPPGFWNPVFESTPPSQTIRE